MNKKRRAAICELRGKLSDMLEELEQIQMDEQEYYDNIPENLQESERAEASDAALGSLSEAYDSLSSAIDSLEEIE